MPEKLADQEIEKRLMSSEWQRQGDAIVRERKFIDFKAAVAFINRVADVAEDLGHHPDISVFDYNHVKLSLSTHSAGGVTDADFRLAERIDGMEEL